MTDQIHTVTLSEAEQAAYASGWNRAIEAAARRIVSYEKGTIMHSPPQLLTEAHDAICALSMPAPAQAWRDISTAPPLERVIVAGWQPKTKIIAGYWWYEEEITDNEGIPINCPTATLWHPMPKPPEDMGQP